MTVMKRKEYISPAVDTYSIVVEQGICATSTPASFEDFDSNDIGWDE
jgi:hypothetical protein